MHAHNELAHVNLICSGGASADDDPQLVTLSCTTGMAAHRLHPQLQCMIAAVKLLPAAHQACLHCALAYKANLEQARNLWQQ
jgi:hypothetical protein